VPYQLVVGVVFGGTLALLLARPRRVPDWAAALGGGLLMVLLGVLSPLQAAGQLAASVDVFLFFLGLGIASATADRAGLFQAAARLATAAARGSQARLLAALFVVGALVTAVLSNDATALLLTPVAFAVATRLGVEARPYAFTCALVANAASFLLPVSNPANLLVLARSPLALDAFLARLLLPSLLALAATLVGLLWVFRDELAAPFEEPAWSGPVFTRRARLSLAGVACLALLYVCAAAAGWPLGRVAVAGAALLVALDAATAGWEPGAVVREAPWALLGLLAGLLLLIGGAEQVGLFGGLVGAIESVAALGANGLPVIALAMALLANVINNLPAALVASSALARVAPGVDRADLAAALIVGVNLGPNLTTVGSLATMLWLVLLRRRGLDVSALDYLRVGVVVTLPALALAAAGLWATGRLFGGGG
jgi:arsenical pump membrane protein